MHTHAGSTASSGIASLPPSEAVSHEDGKGDVSLKQPGENIKLSVFERHHCALDGLCEANTLNSFFTLMR